MSGTAESGAFGFLRSVERVPVAALPDGGSTSVLPPEGTAAYGGVVPLGFRQLGSGKPLVLIAGEDASMSWWSPPLLQALAQHYKVTEFDLPGIGYSGPPTAPVTVDWLADVTAGLISELGLSSPAVLGWGMGGQVALALAERHTALVSDLVLVDTGLPFRTGQLMAPAAAALLASPAATPAALASEMFTSSQSQARQAWLTDLDSQVPDSVTSQAIALEAKAERNFKSRTDVVHRLGQLRLPVLAIAGSEDEVFPPSQAEAIARAIKGAQHYLWNGEGYAGALADPAAFAKVVESFIG